MFDECYLLSFIKGVTLSHHMILNNANQLADLQEFGKNKTIICLQVPLYHCLGINAYLLVN